MQQHLNCKEAKFVWDYLFSHILKKKLFCIVYSHLQNIIIVLTLQSPYAEGHTECLPRCHQECFGPTALSECPLWLAESALETPRVRRLRGGTTLNVSRRVCKLLMLRYVATYIISMNVSVKKTEHTWQCLCMHSQTQELLQFQLLEARKKPKFHLLPTHTLLIF